MSNIEWTDITINPIIGCKKISPGCANCYAATAARSPRLKQFPQYQGVVNDNGNWTGLVNFAPDQLKKLAVKKPTRIFLPSMSDLFYVNVEESWIDRIFSAIEANPLAEVQILTKRAARMLDYCSSREPLSNVLLGVSIEDRGAVDRRSGMLHELKTLGWKTFYSVEPLLEATDLKLNLHPVDWVIVGGESGTKARSCDIEWIRSIVTQCDRYQVPVFVKQLGKRSVQAGQIIAPSDRKGGDIDTFPPDLKRREFYKDEQFAQTVQPCPVQQSLF